MAQVFPISGIYEVCIGVETDAELHNLLSYFQSFGFHPSVSTATPFDQHTSATLYGHPSPLNSIRLAHTDSDHGLVRIWKWGKAKDNGVPVGPLRAKGRRWAASLTSDIFNVASHARHAQSVDGEVETVEFDGVKGIKKVKSKGMYFVEPIDGVIYEPDLTTFKPFEHPAPFVHASLIVTPLISHVLFQRHDYEVASYGKIDKSARFPTSQFTHFGLVATADEEPRFYEETLGLKKNVSNTSKFPRVSQAMLDAKREDGDELYTVDYDDPRSGSHWSQYRSGRLHTLRWCPGDSLPDVTALSNPGSKGMTGYTLRVRDIGEYHGKVSGSGASGVSGVMGNEFGEKSFSFYAPDGYWWQIIEWNDV